MTPVPPQDDADRLDWLQLIRSDNIGPRTFYSLLRRFGSAGEALRALPDLLTTSPPTRAVRIASRAAVEREWVASRQRGLALIALGDAAYPAPLRAVDAPPPLLLVAGNPITLSRPTVAIVGSRNASAAGLTFAERLARGLSEAGFVTVSGLARGIDAAVHRASLRTGTVAVLAGGHARPYPADHKPLLEAITETGVAVSEMPLEWEPRGRDFPRRNRIVSGLSLGTVVVEAARRSGSLITARYAAEQGREVFAVPGSPLDPRAEGANDLLRSGATLCTRVDDVLAALTPLVGTAPGRRLDVFEEPRLSQDDNLWDETEAFENPDALGDAAQGAGNAQERVIALLGPAPVALDDLVRLSALAVGQVQSVLLDLELDGRLERHGGNLVSMPR